MLDVKIKCPYSSFILNLSISVFGVEALYISGVELIRKM